MQRSASRAAWFATRAALAGSRAVGTTEDGEVSPATQLPQRSPARIHSPTELENMCTSGSSRGGSSAPWLTAPRDLDLTRVRTATVLYTTGPLIPRLHIVQLPIPSLPELPFCGLESGTSAKHSPCVSGQTHPMAAREFDVSHAGRLWRRHHDRNASRRRGRLCAERAQGTRERGASAGPSVRETA